METNTPDKGKRKEYHQTRLHSLRPNYFATSNWWCWFFLRFPEVKRSNIKQHPTKKKGPVIKENQWWFPGFVSCFLVVLLCTMGLIHHHEQATIWENRTSSRSSKHPIQANPRVWRTRFPSTSEPGIDQLIFGHPVVPRDLGSGRIMGEHPPYVYIYRYRDYCGWTRWIIQNTKAEETFVYFYIFTSFIQTKIKQGPLRKFVIPLHKELGFDRRPMARPVT